MPNINNSEELFVKDLKLGTTMFCVPVYVKESDFILEIYELKSKEMYSYNSIWLSFNMVLGSCDPFVILPGSGNLNDIIVCYYGEHSVWGWTCNEKLATEWANMYLNNQKPVFYSFWDIESCRWNDFVEDIYK